MKTIITTLIVALTAATAGAEPLQKEHVAADAKWLVHVDVENFLTTQLGGFIGREFFDKQFTRPARDLHQQFGVTLDWRKIQSITAYGSDFQKAAQVNGVLLLKSTLNIPTSLDSVIEKMSAPLGEGKTPLRKIQDTPYPLYTVNDEIFGIPVSADLFLVGKSRERVEKAWQVLKGKAPNLTSAKSFPALLDAGKGFLVAAAADAFENGVQLPPPAIGLKNASGGQVVAGEKADHVFLSLTLNAKDTESAAQIQQVVQGLVAMAALSQSENADLQKLVQGTKVGGHDKIVNLDVEAPTADVIAKVSETNKKRRK